MDILFEGIKSRLMEVAGLDEPPKPAQDYLADEFEAKYKSLFYIGFQQLAGHLDNIAKLFNEIDENTNSEYDVMAKKTQEISRHLMKASAIFQPTFKLKQKTLTKKSLQPPTKEYDFSKLGYYKTRSILFGQELILHKVFKMINDTVVPNLQQFPRLLMTSADTDEEEAALQKINIDGKNISKQFNNFYFGSNGNNGFKAVIDKVFKDFESDLEFDNVI